MSHSSRIRGCVTGGLISRSCKGGISGGVIGYSCRLRDGVSGAVEISHSFRVRGGISPSCGGRG